MSEAVFVIVIEREDYGAENRHNELDLLSASVNGCILHKMREK